MSKAEGFCNARPRARGPRGPHQTHPVAGVPPLKSGHKGVDGSRAWEWGESDAGLSPDPFSLRRLLLWHTHFGRFRHSDPVADGQQAGLRRYTQEFGPQQYHNALTRWGGAPLLPSAKPDTEAVCLFTRAFATILGSSPSPGDKSTHRRRPFHTVWGEDTATPDGRDRDRPLHRGVGGLCGRSRSKGRARTPGHGFRLRCVQSVSIAW